MATANWEEFTDGLDVEDLAKIPETVGPGTQ